jgi:hypothetical protein
LFCYFLGHPASFTAFQAKSKRIKRLRRTRKPSWYQPVVVLYPVVVVHSFGLAKGIKNYAKKVK